MGDSQPTRPILLLAPLLLAIDFNSDAAIEAILRGGGRILLIVVIAVIANMTLRRIFRPLLSVAIREQMASEPEIEINKRIGTMVGVANATTVTMISVIALVTILPEFGINAGPLIAGLGLVGLAVGFGAQNLVKDLINGLEILTENQYAVGDYIAVRTDNGGTLSGNVEDINLRRTMLRDFDGNVHFFSHGQIDFVTNQTKGYSRAVVNITVAYGSRLDEVYKVVGLVGTGMMNDPSLSRMMREAPHAAGIEKLGDGFMELRVEGVTEPGEQWKVAAELRHRLRDALAEAGIRSKDGPPQ